jgi:aminopeptidase N
MMKYFFKYPVVFLGLLFLNVTVYAQDKTFTRLYDGGAWPAERIIDATHLNADISINPNKQIVTGTATFSFQPLRFETDSFNLSIMDMKIEKVLLDEKPIRYLAKDNNLTVYPGQLDIAKKYDLTIQYQSFRPTYLYFSGWDDDTGIKRKQIWAHRPFTWLPYLDDRLTIDMYVTFDKKYKVFSNGERISIIKTSNSLNTWHYRMNHPHPFFSTALVIGDYEYQPMQAASGLPMEMWYYPEQKDRVEPTYRYMSQMIGFFEMEFGLPYPWELYRQAPVVDYLYGAMETTTSTIFGDYLFVNERAFSGRNYINVNAHELAHQWFGNYITHLAPKDVWLTESFATYYAKMFEKSVFGEDYYQFVRLDEYQETMEAEAKDKYPTGHSQGGRARWYPKGSLILDMLRNVMGDENYKASIKYYLEHYPYQDAETSDFLRSIYYATGLSMDWFFEEWIYRGGEPEFEVKYQPVTINQQVKTQITVRQIHPVSETIKYFRMPIEFEVHYSDGSFDLKKEWVDGQVTTVEVPNPGNKKIAFVLFDPDRQILKKISFEKSFEELSQQLLKAPQMIDRHDALLALKSVPLDQKRDILLQGYKNEKFHLNKSEIISQLVPEINSKTLDLIKKAIHDPDVYVRRAVVQNITSIPGKLKTDYEILLNDLSYINVELALVNLVSSFPSDAERYLKMTEHEEGWRGKNIRIKWLELSIGLGKNEHLPELINYSSRSYEFETRQNALMALKRLNYLDNQVAENLLDAAVYWNYKLAGTAKEVLNFYKQQTEGKATLNSCLNSLTLKKEDFETLKKLIN